MLRKLFSRKKRLRSRSRSRCDRSRYYKFFNFLFRKWNRKMCGVNKKNLHSRREREPVENRDLPVGTPRCETTFPTTISTAFVRPALHADSAQCTSTAHPADPTVADISRSLVCHYSSTLPSVDRPKIVR